MEKARYKFLIIIIIFIIWSDWSILIWRRGETIQIGSTWIIWQQRDGGIVRDDCYEFFK